MAKKQSKSKRPSNKLAKAPKVKPLNAEHGQLLQRSLALHQAGRLNEAVKGYQLLLSARPDSPQANFLYGALLSSAGHKTQALGFLQAAVNYDPKELKHYSALGELLCSIGRYEEAEQTLATALKIKKHDATCLHNYGVSLINQHKFSEAKRTFEQLIDGQPEHVQGLNNLGNALVGLWEVREANRCFYESFAQDSSFLFAASNLLLNLNYDADLSTEALTQKHLEIGRHFPQALSWDQTQSIKQSMAAGRKIKLGFVSGDFYTHAVAMFFKPLLEGLSREKFELYLFYNSNLRDSMTEHFQSLADYWIEMSNLSDDQFVKTARDLGIDIAIDLSGHTNKNRLAVFSKRLAPIQMNWLGYPNITGVPAMDYRLVDAYTDPEDEEGLDYPEAGEQRLRMAGCFLCYEGDATLSIDPVPPVAKQGSVTFGSFNNLLKVNDAVIRAWANIVSQVEHSRLLLKAKQLGEPSVRERVIKQFEAYGVSAERLILHGSLPSKDDHMRLYSEIDVALDTFPYNGTTTTCEAMWMGVPVVSFTGDRHAARVGASLLKHAGMDDCLADSLAGYVDTAVALAAQPDTIASYRVNLRSQIERSPLGDRDKFVASFECMLDSLTRQGT